jgi:hypothetical protein
MLAGREDRNARGEAICHNETFWQTKGEHRELAARLPPGCCEFWIPV